MKRFKPYILMLAVAIVTAIVMIKIAEERKPWYKKAKYLGADSAIILGPEFKNNRWLKFDSNRTDFEFIVYDDSSATFEYKNNFIVFDSLGKIIHIDKVPKGWKLDSGTDYIILDPDKPLTNSIWGVDTSFNWKAPNWELKWGGYIIPEYREVKKLYYYY